MHKEKGEKEINKAGREGTEIIPFLSRENV
jgi:hypothetical protein